MRQICFWAAVAFCIPAARVDQVGLDAEYNYLLKTIRPDGAALLSIGEDINATPGGQAPGDTSCHAAGFTETNFAESYQIIKEIGRGSFGIVFLVKNIQGHRFAMKEIQLNRRSVPMLKEELAYLAHEGARPFNLFTLQSSVFCNDRVLQVVTPLLKSELGEFVDARHAAVGRQQSPWQATPQDRQLFKKLVVQIAFGIFSMHQNGIMHRDLKLANVLLTGGDDEHDPRARLQEASAIIIDFGLATKKHTATDSWGTPIYMHPKMHHGVAYGAEVDWFAFGIMLYEMVLGQHPCMTHNYVHCLEQLGQPTGPGGFRSTLKSLEATDPDLRNLIRACWTLPGPIPTRRSTEARWRLEDHPVFRTAYLRDHASSEQVAFQNWVMVKNQILSQHPGDGWKQSLLVSSHDRMLG